MASEPAGSSAQRALRRSREVVAALEACRKLAVLIPGPDTDERLLRRFATQVRRSEDFEAALPPLRDRLAMDPENTYLIDLLRQFAARSHQIEEALGYARRLCDLEPANSEHWLGFARLAYRNGALDEAEAAYCRCLEIVPNHARALRSYAVLLGHRKQWLTAAALQERLIELDRRDGTAWRQSVQILVRQNNLDEAVERIATACLQRLPEGDLHVTPEDILEAAGLSEEAHKLRRVDATADTRDDELRFGVMRNALHRGDLATAIRHLDRIETPNILLREQARRAHKLDALIAAINGVRAGTPQNRPDGSELTHPVVTAARFLIDLGGISGRPAPRPGGGPSQASDGDLVAWGRWSRTAVLHHGHRTCATRC